MTKLSDAPTNANKPVVPETALLALVDAFNLLSTSVHQLTEHLAPSDSALKAAKDEVVDIGGQTRGGTTVPTPAPVASTINNASAAAAPAVRLGIPTPQEVEDAVGPYVVGHKRFYCVTVGSDVGVFLEWTEVSPLVSGISGNAHKHYKTLARAVEAYRTAYYANPCKVIIVI